MFPRHRTTYTNKTAHTSYLGTGQAATRSEHTRSRCYNRSSVFARWRQCARPSSTNHRTDKSLTEDGCASYRQNYLHLSENFRIYFNILKSND